ncbi:HDOD domain-containing protein [Candidatus Latescibacterota bacterium]
MQKKILFVDDEPKVLQGIRRMLHSMRKEWDMDFAESGYQALEILKNSHFDVIVTDMRMPDMNGLELLIEIKKLYPTLIRIVLSGQASKDVIIQSIGPIHQYMTKPTNSDEMKLIISRTCSIHELLEEKKLKKIVSQIESLPSLPTYFNELMNELQSENATIKSIGKIISKDISMCAKVLQLANSAFFRARSHVSSPEQAVSLLGLEIISGIALSSHAFRPFDHITSSCISFNSLWSHCLNVGMLSKHISETIIKDSKKIDYAFIAGLLHDVGILIFATNIPEQYSSILLNVSHNNKCLIDEEKNVFGVSHEKIGAYLVGLWGFNDFIIDAVAYHHNPMIKISEEYIPLTAVYIANIIEHELFPENALGIVPEIDKEYIEKLNLTDKIPLWWDECKELLESGVKR